MADWTGNGPRPAKARPKSGRIAEDDADANEGASVGRPRRKARAAKRSHGTVGGTGRPKVRQDLQDPADRAGNGFHPAKVPPKIGRSVPAQTASGGRGVPAKIANGLSRDKASFASKDELASKDKDKERNPNKDITAAA